MIEGDVEQRGDRTAFGDDERALSTPVTHALTIAITGLLMITLVSTASGFLTDQQEFAARDEVETIGNRLADDVQEVIGLSNESGSATVYVNQPDSIIGSQYHVTYEEDDDCDTRAHTSDQCLVVSVVDMDVSQTVPVTVPGDVEVDVSRANPSTFKLTAENSGAGSGNDAVVPMSRTMRVGVGRNVDSNAYSEVVDPNPQPPAINNIEYAPGYPVVDTPITFTADAEDPDGTIIDYEWSINDSVVDSGSDLSSYTTTLPPGRHSVTVRVEDDEGLTANQTTTFRVSGVSYNNDLEKVAGGSEGRCSGVNAELSLTNQLSEEVKLTDIYVDPPESVNFLEYGDEDDHEVAFDLDDDGSYDEFYEFGRIDLRDKPDGTFLSLPGDSPLEIDPGQDVGVSICRFKGGGNVEETNFSFRYWHDGVTNRTSITPSNQLISDYSVDAASGDVVVTIDSNRQLGSLDAEISNASKSADLSLSDFTETSSGGTYQYEAALTVSSGTHTVELTGAEDTDGRPAVTLPRSGTATILGGGAYAWQTESDWDAHQSSVGVVHDDYGDYTADSVALGRPPGSVDSSLVSYWPFDGGSVADVVGDNDGIIHGSPTVTSEGISGTSALRFDGEGDYVEVPADSSLEMSDDDQVTVSMWVNKHRKGGWTTRTLFEKDSSYRMALDSGDDFMFSIYERYSWWGDWEDSPKMDIYESTNKYYHVVGVFDGADVKAFVDGTSLGANGAPDEIADASGSGIGIGGSLDEPDQDTNANIDDVRIYDTALNANQVKRLANVTRGSIVTDKRTGSTISKHSDVKVNYEADIDAGETITLTVYAEPDSGSVKSDSVTLESSDSGSGTVSLTGINKDADTFWVRAELNSPSSKRSPELHGVVLQEGS
ncbi:DUF7266 family protein [Halapricum salinum]|uniref:PKD domain-containing protein n=1 Tax=Halapricum salinum TaxID=1457250 RepID=A0A4D6HAD3_9EURY|nr:LamG-like jellyroll fold domain-containing protein [Halapricum salinum]QCC50002.1 PKD domain-containing protein [Halapricum salinum]